MQLEGHVHVGSVLDISEQCVRVAFVANGHNPRANQTARRVRIGRSDGRELEMPELALTEAERHDGQIITKLFATCDETQAELWRAMQALATDEAPAEPVRAEKLPTIPERGHYTEAARLKRLDFLRQETSAPLATLQETRLNAARLTGNIENLIGAVEVPVGLAGPLLFNGQQAKGKIYAPLATSEGALVASATRGATAISRSGGVTTRVIGQRMMRVPVFSMSSLEGAFTFANWIRDHFAELREQTLRVSSHARLVSAEPVILGRMVHVYFLYQTGDAAGQNMTTTCTWQAAQWLMAQVKHLPGIEVEDFLIEANMSGDKKVTFQSFINGRGIRVIAECLIDRETCERTLKVTPEQLALVNSRAAAGAVHVGMIGYNVNVANVIAAMFAATGQDLGCVHESSLGQLYMNAQPDGLFASLVLPSLIVGTVGGGTHLPAQNALLEMMGCAGPGKVFRLAEIIAGCCLSLDLSTLAAVASGEFAAAHEKLGRNRPVRHLMSRDLDAGFFEPMLRRSLDDAALTVTAVEPVATELGSSIITELTARKVNKLLGLIPLRLRYRSGDSEPSAVEVIAKVKPLDDEVALMAGSMATMCGGQLAAHYNRFRRRAGFAGCHTRELGIYQQTDPRFLRHAPRIYGTFADETREAWIVVMERLGDVVLKDTADDVSEWSSEPIAAALRGIAEVHAVWLGREQELRAQSWLGPVLGSGDLVEMVPLWEALAAHAANEFPEIVDGATLERWLALVHSVAEWAPELERMPRTLIHNDFNPRNLCLRPTDRGLSLCAYDWELATLQVPQHDLAELLCFVLSPDVCKAEVDQYVELHRRALQEASGVTLDAAEWRRGYALSLRDLAVNRFAQYLMGHTFRHYGFVERAVKTLWHLLSLEAAG
jgi:NADP-dependent 3-hydroxy-3-methylglutaryl-CoA reductase